MRTVSLCLWRQVSLHGFDLSNMYSISSPTTREPPSKVSAQTAGCTMGNEPEQSECQPPAFMRSAQLQKDRTDTSEVSRYHPSLPVSATEGNQRPALIVSLISLQSESQLFSPWEFTCPNLESGFTPLFEHGLAVLVKEELFQSSVIKAVWILDSSSKFNTRRYN